MSCDVPYIHRVWVLCLGLYCQHELLSIAWDESVRFVQALCGVCSGVTLWVYLQCMSEVLLLLHCLKSFGWAPGREGCREGPGSQ
jgi:hypothetical protein